MVPIPQSVPPEDRLAQMAANAGPVVRRLYAKAKMASPSEIYIRAFKEEKELEIFAASDRGVKMKRLAVWTIAFHSGGLGPKRREGDYQVPEGFYHIDRFNPRSNFWLSLGLNYPNASDRKLSDPSKPGGDIFIHGGRSSIGCLAMTDPGIEQIYHIASDARKSGQRFIPVHIFPSRNWTNLKRQYKDQKPLLRFWEPLERAFRQFEETRLVPKVRVRTDGRYVVVRPGP